MRERKPQSQEQSGESLSARDIAPGRVTRTSRLDMGKGTLVQRKEGRADATERSLSSRSRWDLTMDPAMDAAHRGGMAIEESEAPLDTPVQRQTDPRAESQPDPAASASETKIIEIDTDTTGASSGAAPSKITIKIAMRGGGVFVATSKVYTFEAIALQTYGQAGEYSQALRAANPDVDPKKIFPGKTKFDVPRMAVVESIVFPEAEFDSSKPFSVSYGQNTFNAEGQEGGPYHSRTPHVPSESSGVTLGRGFDMKSRTGQQIYDQLTAAGISDKVASIYKTAAQKQGSKGKEWVNQNKQAAGEISLQQQHSLFVQEYGRQTRGLVDYMTRTELAKQENGEWTSPIDFPNMDSKILELLVDMWYLGDLRGDWGGELRKHVIANDVPKVAALVRDQSALRTSNYRRYEARCNIMGVSPLPRSQK